MKLPNSDQCQVPDAKIIGYLLNDEHRDGGPKSKFFKRFGFTADNADEFKNALIQHGTDRDIEGTRQIAFGGLYKVKCKIKTPDTRNPCIISVWMIRDDGASPQLVTAYRAKKETN